MAIKTVKLPDDTPEGEALWSCTAAPRSEHPGGYAGVQACADYLKLNGINPDQVIAMEFYRKGKHGRLRVELFAVALPPGFDHEKEH